MKRCEGVTVQLQQRVIINFCVKLKWTFVQIWTALFAVFGRATLSDSRIYFWIKEFNGGRTRIADIQHASKKRSGRCRANIRKVEDQIAKDRHATIWGIVLQTGIPFGTVNRILRKDLNLVKRCAKFVPCVLNERQLQRRLDVCAFWIWLQRNCPRVFRQLVTMDEAWIYIYDPDIRIQSKEWQRKEEDRPQIARHGLFHAKVMIVSFFDYKGLLYYKFVQRPQTVNQQVFQAILRRFNAAYHRRRPRASVRGRYFIHMDNAPAHTADNTHILLRTLGWSPVPHPAYSPDLAPSDFWFFARLKRNLRGRHYGTLANLKEAVAEEIAQIPSEEYAHCMLRSWPKRWRKCLEHHGNYFEGLA